MDGVAYPDFGVIQFITDNLVLLRIPAADRVLGPQFRVKWTPALLILDAERVEHHQTLGFYPPEDLIPSLQLGGGKAHFDRADLMAACRRGGSVPPKTVRGRRFTWSATILPRARSSMWTVAVGFIEQLIAT